MTLIQVLMQAVTKSYRNQFRKRASQMRSSSLIFLLVCLGEKRSGVAQLRTRSGIGFNHGVLGLAENPARGTGFWSQNTEGVARGVLTEKARLEGWVFSQAQHPMIKTYYSMSLHCNTAVIVFKLLIIVE